MPHLPDRMFDLVSDMESYPKFVPNCTALTVRPDGEPDTKSAKMTIHFGPITQAYTSRVTEDRASKTITATSTDGPFSYLDSKWTFEPEGQGARIRFDISFKISNPLIAAVAEPAFAAKQEQILDAFLEEADRRFG